MDKVAVTTMLRVTSGFEELVGPELYVVGYRVDAGDGHLVRNGGTGVEEVFGEIVYLSNLFLSA